MALLLLFHPAAARAATVTWDGDAGDFLWQNAANWSGDTLPGTADDVVINVAGGMTITNSATVIIRSLQCSNNLALTAGTFRVTAGNSIVQGEVLITGSPLLSATGSGTTLTLAGPVTPGGASLEATGGATLSLPALQDYLKTSVCAGISWTASGAGSVLDLMGLTNMTATSCGFVTLQALSGGAVRLGNVATVGEGYLRFIADGAGSLVDMPALQQSLATQATVSFVARNGGSVVMPQLTGGSKVAVTIQSGGVLPVAQLTRLEGFSVGGTNLNFPALTNLGAGNIVVDGGAGVTVPNLLNHDHNGTCAVTTWRVTGAGSVLDFSNLETFGGPGCGWVNLQATGGGTFDLSGLQTVTDGTLYSLADGSNSLVNLGALQQSPGSARTVSFEARNGGTMWMPLLPGGANVIVTLQSGGVLPVAQLTQLSGFTVNGMNVTFPALTNLTGGNITASGGAGVTVPGLVNHAYAPGCHSDTWLVTGTGSVLDFPGLATVGGSSCGFLNISATAGGTFNLGALTNVVEGSLNFLADGAASLLDLGALERSAATLRTVSFTARNSGTIAMPLLEGGPTVNVTIQSGGSLDAAQLNLLKGLTISATSLTLPGLTNLFAGDLTVDQSAVLSFPNLFSHDQGGGCFVNTWSVSGANSVLDLSSLTNLAGSSCGWLQIEALAGGKIVLTNLPVVADGTLSFLADGTNSLVELTALHESLAAARDVTFEVRNAGAISMPQMSGGPTVGVAIRSNGILPVAQLARLNGIVVSGTAVNFSGLTNFDGGTIAVSNAAVVSAPNLTAYARGGSCRPSTWLVRDAGSVLDFPGLTQLTGGNCAWLDSQALNGGQLLLGNLTNIPSGTVNVLADGAGSLVDLSTLANFVNFPDVSQLTATHGGTLLLNSHPLMLSGVTVNIAPGTPNLPATTLAATNLVLHGNAWHSYWVENRDTSSAVNPWTFFQRVPLTNDFQTLAPMAGANTEFRASEFVADPCWLELKPVPGVGVNQVFYGPTNKTFELQTTTNLTPPVSWEILDTLAMTNTFRILPPEPLTTPQRFFRIVQP